MFRLRPFLFAATAVAAVASLSACKRSEASADTRLQDRKILVTQVLPAGDFDRAYTGVVAARVQSGLGFRVQGKVTARLVDTGQKVRAGQALMRIDVTDYTHAITIQAGDVASARARWVEAAADMERYRGLVASGAVSKLMFDRAKAEADSTRALLSAAEAQQKVARNQGDYSVLLAESDGTVVETLAEPGQVVAAGETVIMLAHAGPREASVDLPETERPALGSAAKATLYGGAVSVAAHLRQLSDAADPLTRTYEARYVLEGEGAQAPLGATVTLHLPGAHQGSAVQVPLGALDDEGHGPGIWQFDPGTAKVSYHAVSVARLGSEFAVLSGGASAGQRIVAAGGHYLLEGERVQMVGEKAAMR